MSTIPERQEIATAKYEDAASVVSDIANGDEATEVPTESGPTPTIKKWMKDRDAQLGSIEVNADRAEIASDHAQYSAGMVKDTAEGIATGKRYFSVLSPDSDKVLMIYENVAGVAVDTGKRTPSASAIPTVGVEGYYNLVDPASVQTSGKGLDDASGNYSTIATIKSIVIRVDPGLQIVIYNPNAGSTGGVGASFFTGLPTANNKVAAFSKTKLTNISGLGYRADVVPAGAKYLVLNTEYQGVRFDWFAAYDSEFHGPVAYVPAVAKINDLPVFDREAQIKIAAAFSSVEGNDNLYNHSALLVGNLNSTGVLQFNITAWRYARIAVREGKTYAVYTGANSWAFPVAGSYGVSGANPVAGSKVTFNTASDSLIRTFTVPTGQGITHLFFNVFIGPTGGDIDFTSTLIVREGSAVPVKQLPYEAVISRVNGYPLKDSYSREAIGSLSESLSKREGTYNLVDPASAPIDGRGIDDVSGNYTNVATIKSIAIPVEPGMPMVIYNPNSAIVGGVGASFFADLQASSSKISTFSKTRLTNISGMSYRYDVVPVGAKYLIFNSEFRGIKFDWFAAYDSGFKAPASYSPTIVKIGDTPITDRGTQVRVSLLERQAAGRFTGEKVYYFGDSITQGVDGVASYVNNVNAILGCIGTNYGSAGARASRLVGIMTNLPARDGSTIYDQDPDYAGVAAVTIMIGTNDTGTTGILSGSIADIPAQRIGDLPFTTAGGVLVSTPEEYWALFPNTYYGNLSLCIEYVKWRNPRAVIYLISGMHRGTSAALMGAVVVAQSAIGKFYSVQCINATDGCGIDSKGLATYSYDMLHPNDLGRDILGRYIGYKILNS